MAAYFEAKPVQQPFDPVDIFTQCVEGGGRALLLDQDALPAEFFDLGTRLAGELLHKLSTYRIRMAGVVPDPSVHPTVFQDFLRETNTGQQFRFFPTRQQAIDWLESEGAPD